jgi:hypothetical protein
MGDNHTNVNMVWGLLKIFFSRTNGPFLTRLGTNHPWVMEIQVCSKKGDSPSPRGDDSKRVKNNENVKKNLLLQNQPAKFNQTG